MSKHDIWYIRLYKNRGFLASITLPFIVVELLQYYYPIFKAGIAFYTIMLIAFFIFFRAIFLMLNNGQK